MRAREVFMRLLLALGASATLGTSSAWAAPVPAEPPSPPRLLVLSLAEGRPLPGESSTLAAAAEHAVESSRRFALVSLQAALDPSGAAVRRRDEEAAALALRQGQALYNDLDGKKAYAQLDRAVRLYEQTDLSLNFAELTRAWVMRIAAQIANGDVRAAHQDMERLLPLSPRAEFSSKNFSPEDLARVAQLRREALQGGPARLSVESSPVSAKVYLDGQFRGVSPLNLFGLTSGEHFLTVVAPGYQLFQQRVRGGTLNVLLKASEGLPRYQVALGQFSQAGGDEERLQLAQRLAKSLGADQCLLAVLRRRLAPGKRDLLLVRLDTLERGRAPRGWSRLTLDTAEPFPAQVEGPLAAVLEQDAARTLAPAPPEEGTRPPGSAGLHVTPGLALLGAGAALLAAGVTFGVLAAHEHHGYQSVQTVGLAAAHPYQVRGKRDAVLSDVFGAAGLVSLGVGGYFTWFLPPPAAAPDTWETR